MTLGEKIKDLRKKANISQEDLAEKVGVSRQAVTKWEKDLGLPDIENLKSIASLFNISIDELLDYKKQLFGEVILEEKYSLDNIEKAKGTKSKEETFLIGRFPKATSIYSLLKKKKWSWKKDLFWFLIEPAYSPELEDVIENGLYSLFLVEEKDKQYLVTMKKGNMKIIQLKTLFNDKKLIADGYVYRKHYKVK